MPVLREVRIDVLECTTSNRGVLTFRVVFAVHPRVRPKDLLLPDAGFLDSEVDAKSILRPPKFLATSGVIVFTDVGAWDAV
jgi:hypothetical protein